MEALPLFVEEGVYGGVEGLDGGADFGGAGGAGEGDVYGGVAQGEVQGGLQAREVAALAQGGEVVEAFGGAAQRLVERVRFVAAQVLKAQLFQNMRKGVGVDDAFAAGMRFFDQAGGALVQGGVIGVGENSIEGFVGGGGGQDGVTTRGHANPADQALLPGFQQRFEGQFRAEDQVKIFDVVYLAQVNVIGLQASQAGLQAAPDKVFDAAGVVIEQVEFDLGRQENAGARDVGDELAQEDFGLAVDGGGVEIAKAQVIGGFEGLLRVLVRRLALQSMAEPGAAQAIGDASLQPEGADEVGE